MSNATASPRRRHRRTRLLALLATSLVLLAALPGRADAIDLSPRNMYAAWSNGNGIQVGGTYTPIVGNFDGDKADDIIWYAPGTAPDSLWISTGRGAFTKVPLSINGTYTPVVGDFAGDSWDDIIWYAPGSAADSLWISVDTSARFSKSATSITGTYQPIVLEGSLDYAIARTGASGPFPRDSILWYRPGTGSDTLWQWPVAPQDTPPTPHSVAADIPGSPQLFPAELTGDNIQDLVAYTPGSGPDALYRYDTGVLVPEAKTVNGTYTPQILGAGYKDSILWLGPGSATDAYWGNLDCCGMTSVTTQAVNGTRVLPTSGVSGWGYIYDPNGPDKGYLGGYVITSLDADQGPGAQVLLGDFDGDLSLDSFFYRPGSGRESIGYIGNTLS